MKENNIVKETCNALDIKFKDLAQLMGVHEATPAQWSSKGKIPETAIKFMQTLQAHKRDKEQLDRLKNALQIFREIA